MFCESCGKKLIRGYQFCIECGTPVPPNADDEDAQTPQAGDSAENETADALDTGAGVTMPGIQPVNSDGGSLVFCSNCGMHMQSSPDICEKCGRPLGNKTKNNAPNGGVPLVNNNPLGDDFGDMSEGDIEEINNFMNGLGGLDGGLSAGMGVGIPVSSDPSSSSGDMGSIGGKSSADDLEQLTQQLASFGAGASDMPAIGIEPVVTEMRQAEPKPGEAREMENFSMEGPAYSTPGIAGDVPVINGGSMDENPAEDVSLDPYAFVNNVLSDEPAPVVPAAPAPAVSEPEPAVEEILNSMQSIAPAPAVEAAAPVMTEPVIQEAAPVISEPVAEIAEEDEGFAPIYEPEPVSSYQPPVMETAPFIEEGAPVIAEGSAFMAPPAPEAPVMSAPEAPFIPPQPDPDATIMLPREPQPDPDATIMLPREPQPQPQPEPIPVARPAANKQPAAVDPVLGKLSYCRNCGQDMYENEPTCKNCGAPYRAPKKHDPSLDKKGGAASSGEKKPGIMKFMPAIVGGAAVVAIIVGVVVTTPRKNPTTNSGLTGNETLAVTTPATTTSAEPVESEPDNDQIPAVAATADAETVPVDTTAPAVSEEAVDVPPEVSEDTHPEKPDTAEAETTSVTHKTVPHTTGGAPTGTTPANTTTVTTKATTKTATTTKATTKATTKTTAAITSPKTASLEKDRDAIMDAVSIISGEVGKIDALAQNVIYAMDSSTGNAETARTTYMNRDFAKNLLSSIENGKTAVDNAVSKAKPTNSELNSMYDSLVALQKKYTAYYNFIKSPSGNTSKYTSSCSTYMSDFTTAVNGFKHTKFTSSYSDSEINAAYKAAMSDAITAANNAISAFNTLQGKISKVGNSGFDTAAVKELSGSANTKTLANAVAYTQEVAAYRMMLASAPAAYSGAYNDLKTVSDNLNTLVDIYNMIQEHDLSSYKSESNSCISAANTAIQSCTKAIS